MARLTFSSVVICLDQVVKKFAFIKPHEMFSQEAISILP